MWVEIFWGLSYRIKKLVHTLPQKIPPLIAPHVWVHENLWGQYSYMVFFLLSQATRFWQPHFDSSTIFLQGSHSEPAPTRAPPTRCPITRLDLLLVAGRRIGFWPVLGSSHFSQQQSVLVLHASMWEPGWFLIFLEISVGENWPSSKYTPQFSQIAFFTCFFKS